MQLTTNQTQRIIDTYRGYAGETITCALVNSTIYIYGSEIATLRLFRQCHTMRGAYQGFSQNLNTFYFSFETNF